MDRKQILWDIFLFGLGLTLGTTSINFNHVDQTIQQIKYETVEVKRKFIRNGRHYVLVKTAHGMKEIVISPFEYSHIRENRSYKIRSRSEGTTSMADILEEN